MDTKTKESGLQRYTGIKKYGKKGFEALQKAGREGASEEEKGAIKDKYLAKKESTNEGLGDMAAVVERDHEVQMARADLYKIAKYAIKLHEMLKTVSEAEGIEGWQQSKITKAADYIGSVYHSLDYEMNFGDGMAEGKYKSDAQRKAVHAAKNKKGYKEYTEVLGKALDEAVENLPEDKKKGLYYYVNKRKKAGTSRPKGHKDAPTDQDWKNAAKTAKESTETLCSECGKPSYTTLPEEKQKGVDGKVCWKGYKRMGTKMKGGKRVDNCVKM